MRKVKLVSLVTLISVIMTGCAEKSKTAEVIATTPQNTKIVTEKIEKEDSFDRTLSGLLKSKAKFIEIVGEKEYKEGDNISFTLDTKEQIGYLYIITSDSKQITFLQPNPVSPLSQIRGKKRFPDDFTDNQFSVKAVKHCKGGCKEEKTIIYALLTEKPIDDIEKISKDKLLSFYKNSHKAKRLLRGAEISIINSDESKSGIGKMEFWVK